MATLSAFTCCRPASQTCLERAHDLKANKKKSNVNNVSMSLFHSVIKQPHFDNRIRTFISIHAILPIETFVVLGCSEGGNLFRTLINEDASSMQFLARVLEGFCALVQFFWCRAMLYGNKKRKLKVYVAKNTSKKLSTCVFF